MQFFAQSIKNGLTTEEIAATLIYTILGVSIMLCSLMVINKLFDLKMRRELVEENNIAYGVMIGGMAIAIAIIVAGTILS